ncbi:MAG TPA: hypothetical protein VN048_16285 [Verrucomicrobiae bacterium]|jgi:hypothetical protein|nr:hypothetical protein [Verrucomicrobiae bacterium]
MNTMKNLRMLWCLMAFAMLALLPATLRGASDLDVRQPVLDGQGRFWIYRNGPAHPPMPFSPYGWSSDATNLTELIHVDLDCRENPNPDSKIAMSTETEQCIRVHVDWKDATWISIAFISGPAKPPWWGETNRGRYFDLSGLAKKKLVFYARGEHGGEIIQAQMGMLGDKPFGDSLHNPVIGQEMKLTQDWVRQEIDLKDLSPADLAHICNGFGVIVERANQSGSPTETQFYLDDIYFE